MSAVPVPDAEAELGVHDLAQGPRRLALHRLRIELEVARLHERIHELFVVGDPLRTPLLAHFAALLFRREHLFLSDDGDGRRTHQQPEYDDDCFFHST